jgi:hypothetical protein
MPLKLVGQLMTDFLQNYIVIIVPTLLVFNIFFLILVFISIRSKKKVYKRYYNLIADFEEKNLDYMLNKLRDRLNDLEQNFIGLEKANKILQENLTYAIQHVGVVRYNAFHDIGSDLSFSIALLDKHANGVVITSIYGREESRIFAKPIRNKRSTYRLTEEENEAITKAVGHQLAG